MSQRVKSGLSRPILAVSAVEPFDVGPISFGKVSCAWKVRAVSDTPSDDPAAFAFVLRARKASAVPPGSEVVGVAQPVESFTTGVGHGPEVEPLPDVRSTDARSAQIRRPDGVTRSFQVSRYSVEPIEAVRTRNLFAKDDWRAALPNEAEPFRPEVSSIGGAFFLASGGERLARTGASPHRHVVRPPGQTQCMGPDSDTGEGVELVVAFDVVGLELDYRPCIDPAAGDVA
jgi:hypothetical protein